VKITHKHEFEATLTDVSSMLTDPAFARERAAALGTEAQEVDIDAREDGTETVVLRARVPATSIPAEFRSLLGRDLTVTYTEVWEPLTDADRVGTFAVEIAGAPGHVSGAIGITARGATTELLATGDVIANVPLVGPMIERAVAGAVERAFTDQLSVADSWLTR
jgi:hypothetical protein